MFVSEDAIIGVPFCPILVDFGGTVRMARKFRYESKHIVHIGETFGIPCKKPFRPRIGVVGLAKGKEISDGIVSELDKNSLLHLME
jgi:hypothetical protein